MTASLDLTEAKTRLVRLAEYNLSSPRLGSSLDELCRGTAQELDHPVSLLSTVAATAQVFIAGHGLTGWPAEIGGLPIEWSFCATVVRTERPYLVVDAALDPVHAGNPLVALNDIGSYAGVPVTAPDGMVLGVLCVMDATPRGYGDVEVELLLRAAATAARLIEEYRVE